MPRLRKFGNLSTKLAITPINAAYMTDVAKNHAPNSLTGGFQGRAT